MASLRHDCMNADVALRQNVVIIHGRIGMRQVCGVDGSGTYREVSSRGYCGALVKYNAF
jgi:hypothetical protein